MNHSKQPRILAIAPSSKGIGFAILEDRHCLVDWGVRSASGDKNAAAVKKAGELMTRYRPSLIVLEDTRGSRRATRIKTLTGRLAALASRRKIKVALLLRSDVHRAFCPDGKGTKYEIAKIVAARFPAELGSRLPPKRKPWQSEDARMDIFDAVALAVMGQAEADRGKPNQAADQILNGTQF